MKKRTLKNRSLRVVWAVDPFHEKPKTQLHALQSFLKIRFSGGASVQPVAVLHPGSYDPVTNSFPENWRELAGAALGNLIESLENVAGIIEPVRLLRVEKPSLTASVAALIQFATEEGASLVLVSSHGRKGMERLSMGSFAETLVLRSPVPVLVASPRAKTHQLITTLIYATDFSPASKKGFDRVLSLAGDLGLQVLLYHKVRLPYVDPSLGIFLPPVSRESLRELKKETAETADAWRKRAERSGVKTKFQIDVEGGAPLDSILKLSRRLGPKAMIAMAAQSGSWSAAFLGSLTRQVLRSADCPVLVVHADQPALTKRFAMELRSIGYAYTMHPLIT